MKTRTKIELTVLIIWVVSLLVYRLDCTAPCMTFLGSWLATWWISCGAVVVYYIWRCDWGWGD